VNVAFIPSKVTPDAYLDYSRYFRGREKQQRSPKRIFCGD